MALTLQNLTIDMRRDIIRFLTVESAKPAAGRMVTVYEEDCAFDTSVKNGVPIFFQAVKICMMAKVQSQRTRFF